MSVVSRPTDSWFFRAFFFLLSLIISIFFLDYKFPFLPLNGTFLFFYILFIFFVSIWLSSVFLQRLLKENKPITYSLLQDVRFIYLKNFLNGNKIAAKSQEVIPKVEIFVCDENDISLHLSKIDDRIEKFVKDVSDRFLKNWFSSISDNEQFVIESEKLLDEIVRRFLQVIVQIDVKKFIYLISIILLRHIKEFRKSLVRAERKKCCITECYRYAHTGSKSKEAFEHFTIQLTTKLLKQFVSSELWNSLLWKSLLAILAKKLTTNLMRYISQPKYINYKLISSLIPDKIEGLNGYIYIELSNEIFQVNRTNVERDDGNKVEFLKKDEVKFQKIEDGSTPKLSPKKNFEIELSEKDESSVKIIASEPVKIYSSSSNKTWRNSSDLESISLGEDLLALQDLSDPDSQIQNLIEKKLWKDNSAESEEKSHNLWNIHESWFGEEEGDDNLGNIQSNIQSAAQIITNTIKPIGNVTANTIQNMKEFQQSTVNTVNSVVKPISQATSNAKNKIGDLQDEAAGVVEGIIDFGMAGIRKGLRLTGLQDNLSDLTGKSKQDLMRGQKSFDLRKNEKEEMSIKDDMQKESSKNDNKINIDNKENKNAPKNNEPKNILKNNAYKNTLKNNDLVNFSRQNTTDFKGITMDKSKNIPIGQRDDAISPRSYPKLSKHSCITSDDEKSSSNESEDSIWTNPLTKESPNFDGQILLEKTPTTPKSFSTDLAMRLTRSNDQKEQEVPQILTSLETPNISPDLEYEDATDLATTTAKLRSLLQQKTSDSNLNTPALSPMPQDENIKLTTTPLDPNELSEFEGVMPSLYKFYNKTATGLQNTFNTIKTALPGTEKTPEAIDGDCPENWNYEYAEQINEDFYIKMEKLLHERRDFCTVDPAYDYLEILDQTDETLLNTENRLDDELDEFDFQIPITKTLMDLMCELIFDSNSYFTQEPVVKAFLVLFGKKSEEEICNYFENAMRNIKYAIGKLPQNENTSCLEIKMDEAIDLFLKSLPVYLKEIIGGDTLKGALKILLLSLQFQKINQDVLMQIFEVFTLNIVQANNLMSPAYSA